MFLEIILKIGFLVFSHKNKHIKMIELLLCNVSLIFVFVIGVFNKIHSISMTQIQHFNEIIVFLNLRVRHII